MSGPFIEISTLTCPNCGHSREESMPTDVCQFFYKCENCEAMLRPKTGDCCVYCSYASVKCPTEQLVENGENIMDYLNSL